MTARIFLAFNALAIGTIGVLYLIDPNILLGRYGLETGSAGMDNMLRATYGGLFLASSSLFLAGIFMPSRRRDAIGFVILFMTGTALGRLASMISVGAPPDSIMPLLYFELIVCGLGIFLYSRAASAP